MKNTITDIDVLLSTITSDLSAKEQAEKDMPAYFDSSPKFKPNRGRIKRATPELIIASMMPNPYFI